MVEVKPEIRLAVAVAVELASGDNGSGDDYTIVFTEHGAFMRGFDHKESSATACLWRRHGDVAWQVGDVEHLFDRRPLSEELVRRVNPEMSLDALAESLRVVGYPV